jgi:hypothetical protein
MEEAVFERIPSLRIIICRQCQYGVRPADVPRHLKQQHQYSHQAACQVADAVRQWEDVEQDSDSIQVPRQLEAPLTQGGWCKIHIFELGFAPARAADWPARDPLCISLT